VGPTPLSAAFGVDFAFDLDFDPDREGHDLSRAEKLPTKSTQLQPLRAGLLRRTRRQEWERPV
jgi:hypothetical protein